MHDGTIVLSSYLVLHVQMNPLSDEILDHVHMPLPRRPGDGPVPRGVNSAEIRAAIRQQFEDLSSAEAGGNQNGVLTVPVGI